MTDPADKALHQEIERLTRALEESEAMRASEAASARQTEVRLSMFEAMLDIVPVGIVVSDRNGRVIMGNSMTEEMLRHPVIESETVSDYGEWVSFHEDGCRVTAEEYPLYRVIKGGEARSELDVHYQRGDGTRLWIRIVGKPVLNDAGQVIGAAVAVIDIDRERRLTKRQDALIGELDHRVKNAFSVVKSIVSQSMRRADVPVSFRATIDQRLDAYVAAHARLVATDWAHADLEQIAADVLLDASGGRVRLSGPAVKIPGRQAIALSMAFYELSTNSLKYGSLSAPDGWVDLSWQNQKQEKFRQLVLQWTERGGPPTVKPTSKGYGSFIFDRALSVETGGMVKTDFSPQGFEWHLTMPLMLSETPHE